MDKKLGKSAEVSVCTADQNVYSPDEFKTDKSEPEKETEEMVESSPTMAITVPLSSSANIPRTSLNQGMNKTKSEKETETEEMAELSHIMAVTVSIFLLLIFHVIS